jgi:mannose-6-phosphate isomerase-like protein (cupin superfamily)
MQVTRLADARPYEAPNHVGTSTLRLQGYDATGTKVFWVGLSHFLPGGGTEHADATPVEKVYVVLEGEVTIVTDEGEVTLGPLDSCYLAPNETRAIENRTNRPATMLTVITYPPGQP